MVVLDTAALLYWTLDPSKLSPRARSEIKRAGRVVISSISVWEIALKVKRGKLELPLPVSEYADRLQRTELLDIQPVDVRAWLDNLDLDWEQSDPADRTIVATAFRFACPLVTSDRVMADFYPESIW